MEWAQPGGPVLSLSLPGMNFGGTSVLGPVDLVVQPGETVAITGPSGVGKTTLLRIVAGLERRHEGRVEVQGKLAFVFQEPTLLPWRTVRQNLTLTTGIADEMVGAALEEVGLTALDAHYPGQLSLGQQRRLSLARAFAVEPDLLLLDEPFVSLDLGIADDMMRLFATLRARRQTSTLLVTHSRDEAEKLSSRIICLCGTPAVIAEERQNRGEYFQLSASGVTSSKS